MPRYYVNRNAQPSGEHEVHKTSSACPHHADAENQKDLGYHDSCRDAIRKAKETYSSVDGCAYCVPNCHTR